MLYLPDAVSERLRAAGETPGERVWSDEHRAE